MKIYVFRSDSNNFLHFVQVDELRQTKSGTSF